MKLDDSAQNCNMSEKFTMTKWKGRRQYVPLYLYLLIDLFYSSFYLFFYLFVYYGRPYISASKKALW